jgi:outer membrane protein
MRMLVFLLVWTWLHAACVESAEPSGLTVNSLSLQEARASAILNHPRIAAAVLSARSAQVGITYAQSAYYPVISGAGTAAWAKDGLSRMAAGGLSTPSVYRRSSVGLQGSQLITDFGRTSDLVASARSSAQSQDRLVDQTREEILFDVDRTYFTLLQSQVVRRVASETVATRQRVVDQVTALARHQLRSDLDVGFANVGLEEGRLLLAQSDDDVSRGYIELANLMGVDSSLNRPLVDAIVPMQPAPSVSDTIVQAERNNPSLAQLASQRDALLHLARANGDQALPTLSLVGAAGYTPVRDLRLPETYAAAAVNLFVPLFNGFAYSDQQKRTYLEAQSLDKQLQDASATLETNIRVAIERLTYLLMQVSMMQRLSDQAHLSYKLAESRYRLGSSSIIELSQAQLNQTDADIGLIRTSYDYRIQLALIKYYVGYPEVLKPIRH